MKDDIQKHADDSYEHTDEDVVVDSELEDIEENSAQKIKKLKEALKESEAQKMQYLQDLQRAKADFLNGKRRLEEERLRDKQRTIATHVEKLIPLCDSFKMAKSDTKAWDAIDPTWRKGIESIENQLQAILNAYNVQETNPVGSEFDPNIHEAIANVPVTEAEQHNKVISVVQSGFMRTVDGKDELIRPARVIVGEHTQ